MADCTACFFGDFPLCINNKSSFQGSLNIFFELLESRGRRYRSKAMLVLGDKYVLPREWRRTHRD